MDSRLKACVTSAVANPGTSVKSGRWDAHSPLLNIGNGTLELHLDGSHTFREHQQADRLTQQAGVEYDPDAGCPTFTRYLNRTLPQPEVRRVVRALAGLSLLGDNSHHIFPVLIGKGRCGKTTLLEVLAGVLDNAAEPAIAYSGSFSLTILRPKQGGGAGPNASLFRIMSRRFVYCSESNDGVALNAELVKRFCGGDRQEARDTYDRTRGISDRVPAFTPWLGTNKEPYQKLGPPPASLQVTRTVARVSDKAQGTGDRGRRRRPPRTDPRHPIHSVPGAERTGPLPRAKDSGREIRGPQLDARRPPRHHGKPAHHP